MKQILLLGLFWLFSCSLGGPDFKDHSWGDSMSEVLAKEEIPLSILTIDNCIVYGFKYKVLDYNEDFLASMDPLDMIKARKVVELDSFPYIATFQFNEKKQLFGADLKPIIVEKERSKIRQRLKRLLDYLEHRYGQYKTIPSKDGKIAEVYWENERTRVFHWPGFTGPDTMNVDGGFFLDYGIASTITFESKKAFDRRMKYFRENVLLPMREKQKKNTK